MKTTMKRKIEDLKIGDGVTLCLWSDAVPMTIVEKKGDKTIVVQRDETRLDPSFKPDFVVGGFSGVCVNQTEQKWICTPNPDAPRITYTLRKNGRWTRRGETMRASHLIAGRKPSVYYCWSQFRKCGQSKCY